MSKLPPLQRRAQYYKTAHLNLIDILLSGISIFSFFISRIRKFWFLNFQFSKFKIALRHTNERNWLSSSVMQKRNQYIFLRYRQLSIMNLTDTHRHWQWFPISDTVCADPCYPSYRPETISLFTSQQQHLCDNKGDLDCELWNDSRSIRSCSIFFSPLLAKTVNS